MAISFVDKTSGSGVVTGGSTFSVTKPTGVADGDVCFIFAGATDGIGGMSHADWTELFRVAEAADDSGMWVAQRVIAGDGASWAITSTGGENYAWVCVAFRGVDNTTPVGASACATGASSASQVCGPITITDGGAWILCGAESDQPAGGATYSGPGGAFVFDATIGDASHGESVGVGHEDLAGATGSTSRTLTCSIADVYVSAALELIPAASGTPHQVRPDADTATGTWATTPLWSKVDEVSAGGDVITDTAA